MIWSSSLDGALGTDGSFNRSNLSAGKHMITVGVMDHNGLTQTDNVVLTVNQAPQVMISNPLDGVILKLGETISFRAVANDVEDVV